MPTLYIDNFRGFQSTFLSLKNINFFVGENSTGKTSILKLIGIISSQGFWRYNEFGGKETSLGAFSDIISSEKTDKQFFDIGILEDEGNDLKKLAAFKLRFTDINEVDIPQIKEICYTNDLFNVQATIEGIFIKYRFDTCEFKSGKHNNLNYFKSWVENSGLNHKPLVRERMDYNSISSIVLQLQTIIGYELNRVQRFNPPKAIKINTPSFLGEIAWIAPNRQNPSEEYNSKFTPSFDSEGKHTPYVLKDIFEGRDVKKILNSFGFDSGLFEGINIEKLVDEIIQKSDKTAPFKIVFNLNGNFRNITNVGYGVSQILPLLIEVIARPDETWFAIQQPEIHLHPRAQAAFGDFIFRSYQMDKQKFIIETHSDYTIDRFRLRVNRAFKEGNKKISEGKFSQVVFFTRHRSGNRLDHIKILGNGSYPTQQPKPFRHFFIKENLNLITI